MTGFTSSLDSAEYLMEITNGIYSCLVENDCHNTVFNLWFVPSSPNVACRIAYMMNRLSSFAKSPIAAALAWHGYLCLGRGLVYIRVECCSSFKLIRAEYFSQDQYWSAISELEQKQPENRAIYNLICTYYPLEEYLVCVSQVDEGAEMLCFNHLEPPNQYRNLVELGLFQPEDGLLITFSSSSRLNNLLKV